MIIAILEILTIIAVISTLLMALDYHICIRGRNAMNIGKYSFTESIKLTGLPLIKVSIQGRVFNFLLDSGSNVNAVDKSLLNSIDSDNLSKTDGVHIIGTTGQSDSEGGMFIDFNIGMRSFKEEFTIADMKDTMDTIYRNTGTRISGILSETFMQKNNVVLDFSNCIVSFR